MTTKRGPYKRKYPVDATERTCRLCDTTKPVACFPPNRVRSGGYVEVDSRCYDCRMSEKRTMQRLAKYGLSDQEFQTMLDAQDNRCAICNDVFKSTKATHVDHCHATGLVRGLLCHGCNVGIGLLRDDVSILNSAIKYLS